MLLDHNEEYSYYRNRGSSRDPTITSGSTHKTVEADSGQSSNRLFVFLAIALLGLICIGLMGLGGVLFLMQSNRAAEQAALPTDTPTPFPPTFTPTSTLTPTPTDTPEPTPTGTMVVPIGGQSTTPDTDTGPTATVDPNATATNTPVIRTATATTVSTDQSGAAAGTTATPDNIPSSGGVLPTASSSALLWLGAFVVAMLIAFGAVHRLRSNPHE